MVRHIEGALGTAVEERIPKICLHAFESERVWAINEVFSSRQSQLPEFAIDLVGRKSCWVRARVQTAPLSYDDRLDSNEYRLPGGGL